MKFSDASLNDFCTNLNKALVLDADGEHQLLDDPHATSADGLTQVFFRNLEAELLQLIDAADAVVGCVAWLTNRRILAALAKKESVAIVVQKEDFLRPDMGASEDWSLEIRSQYDKLKSKLDRDCYEGTILPCMSFCGDRSVQPVRCVGNHNSDKQPAFPRAHHKFLVFGQLSQLPDEDENLINPYEFKPYAAWTGSFNLTFNATNSLENAIVTRDSRLVQAFYEEWGQIEALSEPLDWSSIWVAPEWRIGS